jgi:uncharacterized oxidoreductase
MNTSGNNVLVTGGASGIGLALVERFLAAGSNVLICGRRADKLREAQEKHPELHTFVCDVAQESGRLALLNWVKSEHPETNVLVNNAGIQRRISLLEHTTEWSDLGQEIAINLEAPIHLITLFLPHLQNQQNPAILNVTSGLSFSPLANVPIYCATKAALHSFTLSLRHQLASTNIEVIELVPPAVNTDLGGVGLHTFGADVNEFADAMFKGIENGEQEIGFGFAEQSRNASRAELDEIFKSMNQQ